MSDLKDAYLAAMMLLEASGTRRRQLALTRLKRRACRGGELHPVPGRILLVGLRRVRDGGTELARRVCTLRWSLDAWLCLLAAFASRTLWLWLTRHALGGWVCFGSLGSRLRCHDGRRKGASADTLRIGPRCRWDVTQVGRDGRGHRAKPPASRVVAQRWQSLRENECVGRHGLAFGPRCIAGAPS